MSSEKHSYNESKGPLGKQSKASSGLVRLSGSLTQLEREGLQALLLRPTY